ncbi:MAG: 5-(carboxyamino)imidazole ribonucleotide synthase [Betaproteobacteria bacterium]|nr:MAG: 5-(carboxyamino)imidazole ribonucleotide synthase [Betaproteobacteria bacterium]
MIAPGAWLGLLGGGQLGRMFSMAAQSMGYRVMVVDPGEHSPAGDVADQCLRADYLDEHALERLARECAAVTTEFENVPAEALRRLAADCFVSPGADSVAVAQDRIREKEFLAGVVGVGPYAIIRSEADLGSGLDASLLPGILKRSRFGYDGKGQMRVADREQALAAFRAMGAEPCVLERMLAFDCEVSVIVARADSGQCVAYPVAENIHEGGILDISIVPARIDPGLAVQAQEATRAVAERLGYVGVLCVEFFVVGARLLANEIAPRPHNSGHYTIDACVTSQFEQQARILARLPLGDPSVHCPAVMVNLLGEVWSRGEPRWDRLLAYPRAKLHLYGKREARRGRKMGHYTVLGETATEALEQALALRAALPGER